MPTRIQVTDYGHRPDDGRRVERIDEELIDLPASDEFLQLIAIAFQRLPDEPILLREMGVVRTAPFDVRLADVIVQPDILYLSAGRCHITTRD